MKKIDWRLAIALIVVGVLLYEGYETLEGVGTTIDDIFSPFSDALNSAQAWLDQ